MPIADSAVAAPLTSSVAICLNLRFVSGRSSSGTTDIISKTYMLPVALISSPRTWAVVATTSDLRSCVNSETSSSRVLRHRRVSSLSKGNLLNGLANGHLKAR